MRAFLLALAICPLIIPLSILWVRGQTQTLPAAAPYIEHEQKEFSFLPGGKLQVAAATAGNFKVTGWNRASIRMEAEKIVYYQTAQQAQALLRNLPITLRHTQTVATIQIPAPVKAGTVVEFNLTLHVPADKTDLQVSLARGDFSVESINGWIEVDIGEGSIEARKLTGYFSGRTKKGEIYAEMSGERWQGLEFSALTHRGSVDLRLPPDYSATLQLQTQRGKISVDYPPRIIDGAPEPLNIVIGKNTQSLNSALGEGGAPIKLMTYFGDIRLALQR